MKHRDPHPALAKDVYWMAAHLTSQMVQDRYILLPLKLPKHVTEKAKDCPARGANPLRLGKGRLDDRRPIARIFR
jgi:hypothetical protein